MKRYKERLHRRYWLKWQKLNLNRNCLYHYKSLCHILQKILIIGFKHRFSAFQLIKRSDDSREDLFVYCLSLSREFFTNHCPVKSQSFKPCNVRRLLQLKSISIKGHLQGSLTSTFYYMQRTLSVELQLIVFKTIWRAGIQTPNLPHARQFH